MTQKKIDDRLTLLGLNGRAPARHLVDLPLPLSACQLLAGYHVLAVAANAGVLDFGRKCRYGRNLAGERCRRPFPHLDPDVRRNVPK
jgi:hypothetical protein